MDLKKNVKTYLYVKKSQLFEKNTIFPIAIQESTQNRKLTKNVILRVFRYFDSQFHIFFWKAEIFLHKTCYFQIGIRKDSQWFFFIIRTDANLCQKLETLLLRDFRLKAQSQYYNKLKSELKPGEFLVTADFAENYAFIVQEAAQAFHWNNNQATLFPLVILVYYKEGGELECCSFVGISDCLKHDTIAIYMF